MFLEIRVSNLNESCVRCLCHVAGCDTAHGCSDGYCGPFYISRVYWVDAGKPTLPDDDPMRKEDLKDLINLKLDGGHKVICFKLNTALSGAIQGVIAIN
ncbi:Uncharacterized protein OBRU01_12280 [Operophtera brumata]|uniref:lysozyme n=1 Tax=Operophtera brumata TaxID=104452 RepID=A0A0L7L6J4_OPEBR|nr:Uncharacterized protein OBRU01_12280 [Operophtera brumata]